MPLLQHLCQLLYGSSFGTAIRESDYAYSIIESVHVISITLLVGTIAVLDLRMLGLLLRPIAITRIARAVIPLTWSGFVVMFFSGALLFWADNLSAGPRVGDLARLSLARPHCGDVFTRALGRYHRCGPRHRLLLN